MGCALFLRACMYARISPLRVAIVSPCPRLHAYQELGCFQPENVPTFQNFQLKILTFIFSIIPEGKHASHGYSKRKKKGALTQS